VWPEATSRHLKFWDVYHRVMRDRVPEQFEEYFAPLDLWTEVRVFPTQEGGIAVFFRRINDRKRAEEALRDEERKYRSLFEHSLDAVYLTRHDGTVLDANRAACQMHGMTVEEIRQRGRNGLVAISWSTPTRRVSRRHARGA
jgi:PAS domain-containing protein